MHYFRNFCYLVDSEMIMIELLVIDVQNFRDFCYLAHSEMFMIELLVIKKQYF